MRLALDSFILEGVTTTIPFLARVMAESATSSRARCDTKFLETDGRAPHGGAKA